MNQLSNLADLSGETTLFIITQLINRDLFDVANTQLSQIEWRIKGQKLTKENVIGYMSSPEGRAAIENLGIDKIQEFFPAQAAQINEGNFVQQMIDKFNQDNIYNAIFK